MRGIEMANQAKTQKSWIETMSDKGLIKFFYAIPWLNIIFSVIILGVFIAALNVIPETGEDDKLMVYSLLLFFIGAILSATSRINFSSEKRKEIAAEMARRYSDGSDNRDYYWLFKREKELNGSIKRSGWTRLISVLSVIMMILTYVCSLFSVLILAAFASAFLVLSFAGCLLRLVSSNTMAEIALSLINVGFFPLKLVFRFAKLVLKPNVHKEDFSSVITELDNYSKTDKPVSKSVAETRLWSYISVNSIYIPHCSWSGGADVNDNIISVKGTLKCDSFVHKSKSDVSQSVSHAEDEIRKILDEQIEKYYKDYPMAERVKIFIHIDGVIG